MHINDDATHAHHYRFVPFIGGALDIGEGIVNGNLAQVASRSVAWQWIFKESFIRHVNSNSRHTDLGLSVDHMVSKSMHFIENNMSLLNAGIIH